MALRQIARILDTVPIKRVLIGDACVDRANHALSRTGVTRNMSGRDLITAYDQASADDKIIIDEAFTVSDTEVNSLVEEVYRIREGDTETGDEGNKVQMIQLLGLACSIVFIVAAVIAITTMFVSLLSSQEVPSGYMFSMLKYTLTYFTMGE